jgi:hypothetical protein
MLTQAAPHIREEKEREREREREREKTYTDRDFSEIFNSNKTEKKRKDKYCSNLKCSRQGA